MGLLYKRAVQEFSVGQGQKIRGTDLNGSDLYRGDLTAHISSTFSVKTFDTVLKSRFERTF